MRIWTVQETQEWYQKHYLEQSPEFVSPMYYAGSENKLHYFISRSMDEWIFIKIRVKDIELEEIKPRRTWTSTHGLNTFPGYYQVDPLNDFMKIEKE